MATLENPGAFNCLAALKPQEPYFLLMGRDPNGASLVEAWADVREKIMSEDPAKIAEARKCAAEMRDWCRRRGKVEVPFQAAIQSTPDSEQAEARAEKFRAMLLEVYQVHKTHSPANFMATMEKVHALLVST